jgi:LysM repeat protein
MAFNFNPVLSEIQGAFSKMSPDAQATLTKVAGNSLPAPAANTSVQAPSIIPHGMLLPHPDAGPEPAPISMGSTTPSLSTPAMPSAAPQLVTGPKRGQEMMTTGQQVHQGTLLGDQTELSRSLDEGAGINGIAHRIEGAMPNHPLLGKILGWGAQVPAMIGDTALESASPIARMALSNVPGTYAHQAVTLGHERGQVAQDTANAQKQAQTASENATAGKTNAETPEVAPEAEARIGLEQAQTSEAPSVIAEHNAQAANLLHPQAKTDFEAWQQQNPGKPIEEWLKAMNANKTVAPEQQYLTEYAQRHPGSTIAEATKAYKTDSQAPQRAPMVNMFMPGANGTETLQTVRPGQTIAAGAQTAAGVNAVDTPTMQQRTAAGRAGTVLAMAPEVLARIDALTPKLGPLEGRWNEFMQGKVGGDDPDFAALRSDLLMMSSAVALAHAQGRLPENLREEFDNAINAPKQTPANLKATINTMLPWLTQMQKQGQPNAPQTQGNSEVWTRDASGKVVKQ